MKNVNINEHSSVRINGNNKVFYFDPFKINNKCNDADYIFISHDHYDHFDIDSILNIINDNSVIFIPEVCRDSIKKLKIDNEVVYVSPYDSYSFDDFKLMVVPSYNINKKFHSKDACYVGYVITIDDKTYYFMGDTDLIDEAKNVKCDVLLIPIGGTYTMDYKEAAELTNIIKPETVIPMHYGSIVGDTSIVNKFVELIDDSIEVDIKIKEK